MLRCTISSEFRQVICTAEIAFSKRSWPYVVATVIPWALCAGQRSVRLFAAMGALRRSASSYYRSSPMASGDWDTCATPCSCSSSASSMCAS